jgi:uncharacterized protein YecE (DUF72 family)
MAKPKDEAQLDLFPVQPERAALLPPDPRLTALAERLPERVHLGSSSWSFGGWTGLVYRARYKGKKHFVNDALYEYARWPLWRTVGIDRSFYSPLYAQELAHYASLLPPGFRCVEKVWQELSTFMCPKHPRFGERAGKLNPFFLDVERFEAEVLAPHLQTFTQHLGAFVFEVSPLPSSPDVRIFEERLEHFLQHAPSGYQYAFELRDHRLMTDRYFGLLREHGAVHCFNQWSHVPPIREQLKRHGAKLGPLVVSRLLLPAGGDYEELVESWQPFDRMQAPNLPMREDVRTLVEIAGAEDVPVYVIINNKAEGSSPLTAIALAEMLAASV